MGVTATGNLFELEATTVEEKRRLINSQAADEADKNASCEI